MGSVLIDHSMSVDGFSTGPNLGVEHPFDRKTDADAEVFDDINAKIAAGRRPPTEEAR
jgi:hypothetical protein